ncbi:DNA N-6-adenine-methyltransferase [Modestobacter roseus]|uniref:DNA N-6-adenine-methyltransferase n=1 Tax=Modestobacter roseus TaxID=1181884 RepID=UPI001296FA1C|nr:hypothetical protein [Modestobacter roseus]
MGRRRVCVGCRTPLEHAGTGRPREYCGQRCRQAVWGRRRRTEQRRQAVADRSQWWTPNELRKRVLDTWDIGLDAAACAESALVDTWLGPTNPVHERTDARLVVWADLVEPGQVVYCNPPYYPTSLLVQFLKLCAETASHGTGVIGLLPASPCAGWWVRWVADAGAQVEFLPGRLRYEGPFSSGGVAPFGAALVHWPARG